jgi:peptidyl-prolyl cis-trans isomerase D
MASDISVADFQQTYARVYRQYMQRSGGSFSEELARSIRLPENVLDQMIDNELLAQAAARRGLVVSKEELSAEIRKIPAFQTEGKFDFSQYQLIIERQLGTTIPQFEADMRNGLLAQKLLAAVTAGAKVSDDEVRAQFVREKDRVDLEYVRFAPAAFHSDERPSDAKVEAFLKEHADRVTAFYKANAFRYHKPKRVKARHILLKVDEKAGESEAEAGKKKLEELRAKIEGGADFAEVAKAESQDPGSKDRGGDLGIFGPGTMDPMFEKAAFELKAGELAGPVRTRFGWHLVKVEEVFPEENRTEKEAEREIASELLQEDASKAAARAKAEQTLAEVKAGKKLEELWPAEEKKDGEAPRLQLGTAKPAVASTGPFAPASEYISGIGMDAALSKAVLGLDEKAPLLDKVWEVSGSYFVIALKARTRADLDELARRMDEYRGKARERKAAEMAEAFVKALRQDARIERNERLLSGRGGAAAEIDNG